MNKTETNRYLMFKAVHAKALEYNEVIQMIPALAKSVKTLGNHIIDIDSLNTIYKTATAGTTAKKSQNREVLVEETDTMCSTLYTYGNESGNQNLMARMDKAESEIGKLRGNELSDLGKQVVKDLQENAANLTEYGITSEEITEYNELVNSYDASADEKDNQGSTAKVARENLSKKFSEVATFLDKEMDKLFKRIRKTNRKVYNEYCEARGVKELGIRHETVVVETEQLQPAS